MYSVSTHSDFTCLVYIFVASAFSQYVLPRPSLPASLVPLHSVGIGPTLGFGGVLLAPMGMSWRIPYATRARNGPYDPFNLDAEEWMDSPSEGPANPMNSSPVPHDHSHPLRRETRAGEPLV